MRWLAAFLVLSVTGFVSSAADTVVPLIHAHAHNDYEHHRPLFDALDHGFCSVEADIYLVNGQLLVAHNRRDVKPERTLQKLYLDPLHKLAKQHNGKIYGTEPRFFLLIDIKSDFKPLYPVLRKVLSQYSDMLTQFENGTTHSNAVTVVLTGGYSIQPVAGEMNRICRFDGHVADLNSIQTNGPVLWISDSWHNFSKWNGRGEMPEKDQAFVRDVVARAHAKGKLVRFWGAPDNATAWAEFEQLGVDLLNTDDLAGMQKFLLANPYPGTLLDAPTRQAIELKR